MGGAGPCSWRTQNEGRGARTTAVGSGSPRNALSRGWSNHELVRRFAYTRSAARVLATLILLIGKANAPRPPPQPCEGEAEHVAWTVTPRRITSRVGW